MLWLMLILLFSVRFLVGGHPNASNFVTIILFLLAVLGALQVVVLTIDMIEFVMDNFPG